MPQLQGRKRELRTKFFKKKHGDRPGGTRNLYFVPDMGNYSKGLWRSATVPLFVLVLLGNVQKKIAEH
jgi:hypothetical protein